MARIGIALALACVFSGCSFRSLDDLHSFVSVPDSGANADAMPPVDGGDSGSVPADTGVHADASGDAGGDAGTSRDAQCPGGNPSLMACTNQFADDLETDTDCGGPCCVACAIGQKCESASDCATHFCSKDGFCYLDCSDGVKNGDETDIDCGGGSCPPCQVGKMCRPSADDCTSHFCDADGICKCAAPDFVTVTDPSQHSYCMHALEVTKDLYGKFLGEAGEGQPYWARKACRSGGLRPNFWPPPTSERPLPVVDVDYCQATAYCEYYGLRLCGRIGGGQLAATLVNSSTASQWFNACTESGLRDYPYVRGSTATVYRPDVCNGADFLMPPEPPHTFPADPRRVGTDPRLAMCEGGVAGLYMMSGNVWEWEDACDGPYVCAIRGGGFNAPADQLTCSSATLVGISERREYIGFRCCTRF